MQLNSVDLPDPFGPIRPRISPGRTSKLTSCTALIAPKDFEMLRTLRTCSAVTVIAALLP